MITGNIKYDIMYNGDKPKWKMLANTIQLLMQLHMCKRDTVKGAAEFNKAMNNGNRQY